MAHGASVARRIPTSNWARPYNAAPIDAPLTHYGKCAGHSHDARIELVALPGRHCFRVARQRRAAPVNRRIAYDSLFLHGMFASQ
jgi:NAD(P)H-dependent flavin oxidoreductase YrpB (nitropropane dioxygenase family)